MTPTESLHALLLAFNDSVKKLVHDAASSDAAVAEAIEAAVKEERNNANKFAAACAKVVEQLEAEQERSQKLIERLRETNDCLKADDFLPITLKLNEKAIAEYESQSK